MASSVIEMTCPGCGARVSIGQRQCTYCRRPIVISTISSLNQINPVELNKYVASYKNVLKDDPYQGEISASLGACFLKMGRYDQAIETLREAQVCDMENSELYYFEAIALLRGKKAFVTQKSVIDRALECLDTAMMIEPKEIYRYYSAYLRYDFYFRKGLKIVPNYIACLNDAYRTGLSEYDIQQLFELLKVERPEAM